MFILKGWRSWKRATPPLVQLNIRTNTNLAPIVLRPYQERCLDSCLEAIASGSTRIGVSLPTGSGKTTVFISLLSRLNPPKSNPTATKSLIIVNSVELARQTANQVARLFPHWVVEIEQGLKHLASGGADVTIATYQSLDSQNRILKFNPDKMKAVIVDEAHHAAAPSYRRILSYFDHAIKAHDKPKRIDGAVHNSHKIPIIGFSATFMRYDGLALGSVFQRVVYHKDFLQMIKEQWLCDVRFTSVQADLNLRNVALNSKSGDFNANSLARHIDTELINDIVVRTWIDRAADRKSTLVFCVNVAHVRSLTQTFRKYAIDARYLYSETPAAERAALVQAFKAGNFPVLVNCAILTEGADIPNIDCVMVARPTRSRGVFSQMIGRGMRLSPDTGKKDCRIIDFVDSNARVAGVVSAPSLFGLNPNELRVDDETPETLEAKAEELERQYTEKSRQATDDLTDNVSVVYEELDDPFSVAEESSKKRLIHSLSPFAWVDCGGGVYVLELLTEGFVRIEHSESIFVARYVRGIPLTKTQKGRGASPYATPLEILQADTLERAVRGCDTFIKRKCFQGSKSQLLLRSAPWRMRPASIQQKRLIERRWFKFTESNDKIHKVDNLERHTKVEGGVKRISHLTMGEAGNIIVGLRHGSQGRYLDKKKGEAKRLKAFLKNLTRMNMESQEFSLGRIEVDDDDSGEPC